MTTELLLLSFITLAAALLFVECATEVSDAVRFFLYKGNSTASVVGKEPFSVSRSKGLVEQNENEKGYLTDTCLSAQDEYGKLLSYFSES